MPRLTLLLSITLFLCCACQPKGTVKNTVLAIHAELHEQFVPDRRVNRFDLEVYDGEGQKYLFGETTLPEVKAEFMERLRIANVSYVDSITVLPLAELGEKNYALTRHSVANLRSEPGHSQELATQVLLGTPLRVLKQQEHWFFVQCPDGYLAWINEGEINRMTAEELEQWKKTDRQFYTADYGHSYLQANTESTLVGDLVKGGLLVRIGEEQGFTKVAYPDGRKAYVLTTELLPFAEWLNTNEPSFTLVQTNAKAQLGKPYLWGGTSPKGMDCSGFTKTVYWQQGLIIPRDASQQVHAGQAVSYDEQLNGLQAGDFLFFGRFREDGTEKITHVGIYLGEGQFIHSGADNGANQIQNLLPNTPAYAPHRRESLLRARRFAVGDPGIQKVSEHPWYSFF